MTTSISSISLDNSFELPASLQKKLTEEKRPLRVEILKCSGGQGHEMSAQAIELALKARFDIQCTQEDVGGHIFPCLSKERVFNFHNMCARKGWTRVIFVMSEIGKQLYRFTGSLTENKFREKYQGLEEGGELPDLVISVTPLINSSLLKPLQERNIPLLVVSSDLDNSLFSYEWAEKEGGVYRYAIPYNSLEVAEKVHRAVDRSKIRGVGYPVRPEFLEHYSESDKEKFRTALGIQEESSVVGVMMGGLGGNVTEGYLDEIVKADERKTLSTKNHFVVFCGRNEELFVHLEKKMREKGWSVVSSPMPEKEVKFQSTEGTIVSILKNTPDVCKYMALARCWVTKTGSSTFNEGLNMATPMLFDGTSFPIAWEALNFEVGETYQFGKTVSKFDDFIPHLNHMLEEANYEKYHTAMVNYLEKRPLQKKFGDNIAHLTLELLKETETNTKKAESEKEDLEKTEDSKIITQEKGIQIQGDQAPSIRLFKKALDILIKIAIKVYKICKSILLFPVKIITRAIVDGVFFSGFNLSENERKNRRKELISTQNAEPIEGEKSPLYSSVSKKPLDALYFSSPSSQATGNVVIFVLGKYYQSFSSRNYQHLLRDGADVVLFNPTEKNVGAMKEDLKTLVEELHRRNPDRKMLLHSYCVGTQAATAVAGEVAEKGLTIPVIVDRGYLDALSLGKKVTPFARLPYSKRYIRKKCDAQVKDKINKHSGEMLFLTPEQGKDQLMHRRGKKERNMTRELMELHSGGHEMIELKEGDHWSSWSLDVHKQVRTFLQRMEILPSSIPNLTPDDFGGEKTYLKGTVVPWVRRHIVPLFV